MASRGGKHTSKTNWTSSSQRERSLSRGASGSRGSGSGGGSRGSRGSGGGSRGGNQGNHRGSGRGRGSGDSRGSPGSGRGGSRGGRGSRRDSQGQGQDQGQSTSDGPATRSQSSIKKYYSPVVSGGGAKRGGRGGQAGSNPLIAAATAAAARSKSKSSGASESASALADPSNKGLFSGASESASAPADPSSKGPSPAAASAALPASDPSSNKGPSAAAATTSDDSTSTGLSVSAVTEATPIVDLAQAPSGHGPPSSALAPAKSSVDGSSCAAGDKDFEQIAEDLINEFTGHGDDPMDKSTADGVAEGNADPGLVPSTPSHGGNSAAVPTESSSAKRHRDHSLDSSGRGKKSAVVDAAGFKTVHYHRGRKVHTSEGEEDNSNSSSVNVNASNNVSNQSGGSQSTTSTSNSATPSGSADTGGVGSSGVSQTSNRDSLLFRVRDSKDASKRLHILLSESLFGVDDAQVGAMFDNLKQQTGNQGLVSPKDAVNRLIQSRGFAVRWDNYQNGTETPQNFIDAVIAVLRPRDRTADKNNKGTSGSAQPPQGQPAQQASAQSANSASSPRQGTSLIKAGKTVAQAVSGASAAAPAPKKRSPWFLCVYSGTSKRTKIPNKARWLQVQKGVLEGILKDIKDGVFAQSAPPKAVMDWNDNGYGFIIPDDDAGRTYFIDKVNSVRLEDESRFRAWSVQELNANVVVELRSRRGEKYSGIYAMLGVENCRDALFATASNNLIGKPDATCQVEQCGTHGSGPGMYAFVRLRVVETVWNDMIEREGLYDVLNTHWQIFYNGKPIKKDDPFPPHKKNVQPSEDDMDESETVSQGSAGDESDMDDSVPPAVSDVVAAAPANPAAPNVGSSVPGDASLAGAPLPIPQVDVITPSSTVEAVDGSTPPSAIRAGSKAAVISSITSGSDPLDVSDRLAEADH